MPNTNDDDWGEYAPQIRAMRTVTDGAAAFKLKLFAGALASYNEALAASATIMSKYLEESRGIPWLGEVDDLRFCPEFYHSKSVGFVPAMLAAMRPVPGGEIVAVHSTFLRSDGLGKADVEVTRKVYGKPSGAAVWLSAPGPVMVVTESIEKALAIRAATGALVASAYSMGNVSKVNPPADCKTWVIGADRGDAAEGYARKAGRRLTQEVSNAVH
jgi:hypothetical protein